MKSVRKTKSIILILFGILFSFSLIISPNLQILQDNKSNNYSKDMVLPKLNSLNKSLLHIYDFESDIVGQDPTGITLSVNDPIDSGTIEVDNLGDQQQNHVALHKSGGSKSIRLEDNFSYYGNEYKAGELHFKFHHDNSLFGIHMRDSAGTLFAIDLWSGNVGRYGVTTYTSYVINQWTNFTFFYNISLGWMFEIDGTRFGDGFSYSFEHGNPTGIVEAHWGSAYSGGGNGFLRIDDIAFYYEPDNITVPIETMETVHIINNSGWVALKSDGNCTGSGTYSDPYIIEDLIIDVRSEWYCISIENTDVYFIIQNCKFNGTSTTASGIIINNTANGKLINNTVSNNNGAGIYLIRSHNNTILGNTANNNYEGIDLWNSVNNTIIENAANNNYYDGISLYDSNNNTISGNIVINNRDHGILLFGSNNNTISGNTAKDNLDNGICVKVSDNNRISNNTSNNNQIGIYLYYSDKNIIKDNILLGNTQAPWVLSGNCVDNVFSGNIVPSNKAPLIIIFTIIGCCIIAVVVITGVIAVRKRSVISREVKKEEKKRLEKERAEILLQLTQESKRKGVLNCFYHPEREASTKCEKCDRMICLECKMVYHVTHTSGTGDSRSSYSVRHEFCPVCFYDVKIKTYGKHAKIGASIFTSIILIVVFVTYFMMGDLLSLIFLPFLIPIDIGVFVYGPRKVAKFETEKAEFLNSLKQVQPVKEEPLKELFCSECGNQLEPDVSICNYCGNLIKGPSLEAVIPLSVEEETRDLNVFLSYSTLDTDYFQISKIVRRLEFYPEINDVLFWEEDSKQNIVEFMEETLDKTQVFVLFCSENSKKSKAVKGEWQSAYQMVKAGLMKIIPVYEEQKYIPKLLWQMLNVKFTIDDLDEFIENLYKEILR